MQYSENESNKKALQIEELSNKIKQLMTDILKHFILLLNKWVNLIEYY